MLSRSPDRHGGMLHELSREAIFCGVLLLIAQGVVLGGSEGIMRWVHWYQSQIAANSAPAPQPQAAPTPGPSPQQIAQIIAIQQESARQQVIAGLRVTLQHHPEQDVRERARQQLQQLTGQQKPSPSPVLVAMERPRR